MKRLVLALAIILALSACLFLASCGGQGGPTECVHIGGTATCSEKAVCTLCGEEYGEISKNAHNYRNATCDAPKMCLSCGIFDGKALGHDEQYDVVVPTCTEGGITNVTCSRCDYTSTKNVTKALGHDKITETIEAPTCTKKGSEYVTCSRCDFTDTQEVRAIGHDRIDTVVEPTCLEGGITNVTCSRCDYTNTKDPTAPLGHTTSESFVAPTCISEGYTKMGCIRCDYFEAKDFVPPVGHSELSFTGSCAVCFAPRPIVPAEYVYSVSAFHEDGTVHDDHGALNIDKLFDGKKNTTGIYGNESIEYFPNQVGDKLIILLSREVFANEIYFYVCGNWTTAQLNVFDAEGNCTGTAEVVFEGSAYDTVSTLKIVDLSVNARIMRLELTSTAIKWNNGHTQKLSEIEIVANNCGADNHDWVFKAYDQENMPSCENAGGVYYECCICGDTKKETEQHKFTQFVKYIEEQAPTCHAHGYAEYKCEYCEETITRKVSPVHNYVETSRIEPTGNETGSITYTCQDCEGIYVEIIPPTGIVEDETPPENEENGEENGEENTEGEGA